MKKTAIVFGTRPEIIKLSRIIELAKLENPSSHGINWAAEHFKFIGFERL